MPGVHRPAATQVRYAASVSVDTYTVGEAAAILGVSRSTLWSAIKRGRLEGIKRGRDWLIPLAEIRHYELASLGRVGRPRGTKIRKSTHP